jgi:hypothetical protein
MAFAQDGPAMMPSEPFLPPSGFGRTMRLNWISQNASIEHLNTPVNNQLVDDSTEVEVTDPTHPLFGRRFALLSTRPRPHSVGYIFVAYRDTMVLRLSHAATSLGAAPPESAPRTKLTTHAVTELIAFLRNARCYALQPNATLESTLPRVANPYPR